MGTLGRATRGLSAPAPAALLMLLANLCVAGMTWTLSEVPSIWTWRGGAIIFPATVYIGEREAKLARMRAAAATTSEQALTAPPARRGA